MKVVFFTGAGISAESGLATFRDTEGLWEGHDPEVVANVNTWKSKQNRQANREAMLDFYNKRRAQAKLAKPNLAHIAIGELSKDPNYEVHVITQNVDGLHEAGGATSVLHLHGYLNESKSTLDDSLIYPCDGDLNIGDKCEKGSQLRPNIVWFGESVPGLLDAYKLIEDADVVVSVGTSGVVEPAASIFRSVNGHKCFKAIVNPKVVGKTYLEEVENVKVFEANATVGLPRVIEEIKKMK